MDPIPETYVLELLTRGAVAGLCLLLAGQLAWRRPVLNTQVLGVVFAVGTAGYALISSPVNALYAEPIRQSLALLATMNSVFFWWFATALFDDEFEWNTWRILPGIFLAALYLARRLYPPFSTEMIVEDILQQAVVIAMMGHAVWLAVAHRSTDLVEPRRRFRLVFAGLVGLTGIIIALAEVSFFNTFAPVWLTTFHACVLFALTVIFAGWILQPVNVFSIPDVPRANARVETIDDAARTRLIAMMEDGVYRTEGLTIASLADRIAYPEYKLRRLINQGLGFRNFNAFLNSYRIDEAKRLLGDPEKARMQVTQIALELGYGSIAPFNRAFKLIEGITPSAYRKSALVEAAKG